MRWRPRMWWLVVGVLLMLGMTGCWDQHPVEFRTAVTAIAMDPGSTPGQYVYTFLFPNVTITPNSLASTPSQREFYTIRVHAASLIQAIQAVQRRHSRTLYLGQLRILALSTQLPPAVWRTTIQILADSGRFVMTFWLVAAPNAQAVINMLPPSEVVPDVALYRALSCRCQPIVWPGRAWSTWAAASTPGISPAVVEVHADHQQFTLDQLAVLGSHVMLWSPAATEGWAYLTGRIHLATISVSVDHTPLSVGLIRGMSHVRIVQHGPTTVVEAHLQYSGEFLGSAAGTEGDSLRLDRTVEHAVSHQIQQRITAAWDAARATDTDPMGFHRDGTWADARMDPAIHGWTHWTLESTVQFTIRDEGILR